MCLFGSTRLPIGCVFAESVLIAWLHLYIGDLPWNMHITKHAETVAANLGCCTVEAMNHHQVQIYGLFKQECAPECFQGPACIC